MRDLYPAREAERVAATVDDSVIHALVDKVTEGFGGRVDVVPRMFLRTLVDLLDRVDTYADYDPRVHHQLRVDPADLADEELEAFEVAKAGAGAAPARRRRLEE